MSEHEFKAIVVREDGSMSTVSMTFEGAQKTVGGYVEAIYRSGVVALVNEDGLRFQMEPNPLASAALRVDVVGPVVFVGDGGEEFTDAPDSAWEYLVRLKGSPTPPEAVTDGSGAVSTLPDDEARLAEATMLLRSHGYQVVSPKRDAKPKVRTGAPDTSRAIEPKLNSGLGKVLRALREEYVFPEVGATDDELEEWLELTHQSVSAARRNGVIRGLIYNSGLKRKTRSGNDAIVWKAVQS